MSLAISRFRFCVIRPFYWRFVVLFVLLPPAHGATPQQDAKNVLIVLSIFDRQQMAYLDLIEAPVRARFTGPVNFYTTYLNPGKILNESYRESLAETLRRQYSDVSLDVVVAVSVPAIPFAVEYRDRIFPGVPIIFVSVAPSELDGQKMLPGMTGVTSAVGLPSTIDLALHFHPDTNAVAVIDA
jgi:hypothetical protein